MTGNPEKLSELTEIAQNLLADYHAFWDEKLISARAQFADEKRIDVFHSFYRLLKLPAPLVVSVDSPMQMILLPALLRIRVLVDDKTWQLVRESLNLPEWKHSVETLEARISPEDCSRILKLRESPKDFSGSMGVEATDTRKYALDSVFGRPKGKSIDSRLGFFESVIAEIEDNLYQSVAPEIIDWVEAKSLCSDRGNLVPIDPTIPQLRTAVQNLTNMGTTERAALRIFRERGDATSHVPDGIVKQGEMEMNFLRQAGEETVSMLAHALSARNLEPTIYESYPPVLEAMLDGGSTGLWFTGQLSVGFNSSIWHADLDRLPNFTFYIDADESQVFSDSTKAAVENLRIFLANRTPCCPFAEIVFVSQAPLFAHTNEEGRLDSTDGPALAYIDGYKIYSINGVTVSEKTAVSPEAMTVEEIDAEINLEVRRVMMERFGIARYLQESNADIINEDAYGTLYRKRIAGDEPLVMVRVKNSTPEPDGSYRQYFLRVPPFIQTAKEAVAWTFGIDEAEYQPEQET